MRFCSTDTQQRATWCSTAPSTDSSHWLPAASFQRLLFRHPRFTFLMCLQDEIFHVPQTAKYCQGNLTEWDPKITTFPGLYMLGAPYGLAVHALQRLLLRPLPWQAACSTTVLRSLNVLLAAAFFGVFAALYRRLHPYKQPEFATLMVSE